MEPRCRVALIKSRSALVRDLDVKPTVDSLLSNLVITQADSHTILAKESDHDKRRVLLDLIPEKGPKAFQVFMEWLASSQPWLRDAINGNLATVTQEELDTVQEESQQLSRGGPTAQELQQTLRCLASTLSPGPTAQELQQTLRCNIQQYLNTDPSRILEEAESTVYIQQPITVHKLDSEKGLEKMPLGNISELLETCNSPGQRVFVYGEAGTGKSNLCRNIAQSWARGNCKLSQDYDYVFPIPMRSIRSHSVIDIICKDVKLIPEPCKQRIEQELEMKHVLFVLDSFEELSHTTPEIIKLIRREIYPRSSVLITARPGHQLEDEENNSKPCTRAHLEDLTQEQVRDYMAKYPGLHKDVQLQIEGKFGMRFLSRPINLWLVCLFLAQIPSNVGMPDTQTVLLNTIVQHLMLAYCKKKNLPGSNPKPESPYKKRRVGLSDVTLESPMHHAPTEVKVMLEKVGQICYFGLRDKKRVLIIDDGVLSKADVLAMGLFSEGADDNSVTLPHPLFQEYLAALFLSVDKRARQELLKELREESEGTSPRPSLDELLNSRDLENTVRFLVGLSGVPDGLTDLFYLKPFFTRQLDFRYEMNLLRECGTDKEKSQIASALLTAPTGQQKTSSNYPKFVIESHLLLDHLDEEQRQVFLKKFYGYQINSHELVHATESKTYSLDSFVVGMIFIHNCTVRLKKAWVEYSNVPVSMLTERLAAVEDLTLNHCTLCDLTESKFLASLSLTSSLSHSQTPEHLRQPEVSLYSVTLTRVQGLSLLSPPHCTLPATRYLDVSFRDEVNLGSLGQCFTGVGELTLMFNKHLDIDDGQWPSVSKLWVSDCDDVNLGSLGQCFTGVGELTLGPGYNKTVNIDDGQWPSVSKLWVSDCDDVNLGSLGRCFTGVGELTLILNKYVNNHDGQWPSVSKLEVSNHYDEVNLGSLGQCFTGVGELTLKSNEHMNIDDGQWPSVSKLEVSLCKEVNLGSLGQCFTGVGELTLKSNEHMNIDDGQWPSVSKLEVSDSGDVNLGLLGQCFTGVGELTLTDNKHVSNDDVQWPSVSKLEVSGCDDVYLGSLGQCFIGVGELTLSGNQHVHSYDGQWSSVRKLDWLSANTDLLILKEMFVQLEELALFNAPSRIEKTDPDEQTQWHTVKSIKLCYSHLSTDEGILSEEEAREFLTQLCPQAEIILQEYEDELEVYDSSSDSNEDEFEVYDSSSDST